MLRLGRVFAVVGLRARKTENVGWKGMNRRDEKPKQKSLYGRGIPNDIRETVPPGVNGRGKPNEIRGTVPSGINGWGKPNGIRETVPSGIGWGKTERSVIREIVGNAHGGDTHVGVRTLGYARWNTHVGDTPVVETHGRASLRKGGNRTIHRERLRWALDGGNRTIHRERLRWASTEWGYRTEYREPSRRASTDGVNRSGIR